MAIRGGPVGSSSSAVSIPGWRPEDFHRFETNFLEEGVVGGVGGDLEVTERGAGANMSVDVAAGLALIEVTTTLLTPDYTFKTWLHSDAVVNIPVPTADSTNPRQDRIVAVFDMTVDPDGTASNIVSIELVEGTPAGSPTPPATPSNAISLAIIDVPASDTTIGNAQITDDRTFVDLQADVLPGVQREATALTKTRLQFNDFTELTIASGAVTVSQVLHRIDTEADAASDALATITAGYGAGETVTLRAEDAARTVVIKHGTGNIFLVDEADFSLDDARKTITLVRTGSNWTEVSRAAPSASGGSAFTFPHRYLKTGGTYTTTSASFVDIDATNMAPSIACTANTILRVTLMVTVSNSGANLTGFDFSVGGTRIGAASSNGLGYDYQIGSSSPNLICITHTFIPGAGTHVVKPQWFTSGGTSTIQSGFTIASFMVEKIEP